MSIFNRIVVVLLLASLLVLGVSGVLYSFDLFGYHLTDLSQQLQLSARYAAAGEWLTNIENGNPGIYTTLALSAVALLGLILLLLELKPPSQRRVKLQDGTYITIDAVEHEAITAALKEPDVLEAYSRARGRARSGARVVLQAGVRRGNDLRVLRKQVQERVQRDLQDAGIAVSNLSVKLNEKDPRSTARRVK